MTDQDKVCDIIDELTLQISALDFLSDSLAEGPSAAATNIQAALGDCLIGLETILVKL